MTDAGYIATGYVVTAGAVAAYAWSIGTRMRRVQRALPEEAAFDTTPATPVAPDNAGREG